MNRLGAFVLFGVVCALAGALLMRLYCEVEGGCGKRVEPEVTYVPVVDPPVIVSTTRIRLLIERYEQNPLKAMKMARGARVLVKGIISNITVYNKWMSVDAYLPDNVYLKGFGKLWLQTLRADSERLYKGGDVSLECTIRNVVGNLIVFDDCVFPKQTAGAKAPVP